MTFERILVPLDGSPLAEESLPHAVRMARAFRGRLLLFRVLDTAPSLVEPSPVSVEWRLHRLQAQRYLEGLAARHARAGIEIECHLAEGRAAETIVNFVREQAVDLLVIGAYGWGGIAEFPFGGTTPKVVSASGISHAVIRPGAVASMEKTGLYRRILVPVDGSQRAEWAAGMASSLVERPSGELLLLQVIQPPDMPRRRPLTQEETELRDKLLECNRRAAAEYLDELAARIGSRHAVRTRLVAAPDVVGAIRRVAESEAVDLIALAAGGADRAGVRLCSVSQSLLGCSDRPVLVLKDARALAVQPWLENRADPMARKLCALREPLPNPTGTHAANRA